MKKKKTKTKPILTSKNIKSLCALAFGIFIATNKYEKMTKKEKEHFAKLFRKFIELPEEKP